MENILDCIFGSLQPQINIISGIVTILIGLLLILFTKNKLDKSGRIIIYICLGLGILVTLSCIIKILF